MGAQPGYIRQQFADTMLDVGRTDSSLVVVVGDISHGILQPFAKAYPGRYYNIGILEPTMMSMVAGMSRTGLRVVVHTIAPFLLERSFEQIKLDFVYHQLPGNIVTVGSAFDYANLGCTHHCYGDFALLKTLPGVEILCPGSPVEFDTLFKQSYANDRLSVYRIPGRTHDIKFDRSDIQTGMPVRIHEGQDVTLIAVGAQLNTALAAREVLAASGWSAEIIYVHSVRPVQFDLIRSSIARTGRVAVVEEHMRSGGFGDDVLRALAGQPFQYLSASIPDTFVHGYGSYEDLCGSVGLTGPQLAERILGEFSPPVRH